jgi:hypothetical protein
MRHCRDRLSHTLLCVASRARKFLRERFAATNYGRQNQSRRSRRQGISVLSRSYVVFGTGWRGLQAAASRLVSMLGGAASEERRDESRRRRHECPRHIGRHGLTLKLATMGPHGSVCLRLFHHQEVSSVVEFPDQLHHVGDFGLIAQTISRQIDEKGTPLLVGWRFCLPECGLMLTHWPALFQNDE